MSQDLQRHKERADDLTDDAGAALQGNRVAIRCSLTIIRNMYSVGLMPDLLLTNQLVNKMLKVR